MHKSNKCNYSIFGNPVKHSKSPIIHSLFSKQIGIKYTYTSMYIPINSFSILVTDFFAHFGEGANITAPFKEEGYILSNQLTVNAKIAKSVNTLKKIDDKCLLGDNTDGKGLLSDLLRLHFIEKDYSILILGAGGAVRGVLFALLSFGCSISIWNRTLVNAEKLVVEFNKYGKISVFKDYKKNQHFDLVINAISRGTDIKYNFLSSFIVSSKTYFYDMNYEDGNTFFINWCIEKGFFHYSDGIGMLVFQAAHSCFLWHNIFPLVDPVIQLLEKNKIM